MSRRLRQPQIPADSSPGLTFIASAWRALPKSIGERDLVGLMDQSLRLAIQGRFQFKAAESEILAQFSHRSSAGNFEPLSQSAYLLSCRIGGTYALLWERANDIKPWIAHQVIARREGYANHDRFLENRVAPGMAILVPGRIQDDEMFLCRHEGQEVWWCTSLEKNRIVLCRYETVGDGSNGLTCAGSPAKRMTLTRSEWNAVKALSHLALAQAAMPAPKVSAP